MKFITKKRRILPFAVVLFATIFYFSSNKNQFQVGSHNNNLSNLIEEDYSQYSPEIQAKLQYQVDQATENPDLYFKRSMCWSPDTDPKIVEAFHSLHHSLQNSLGSSDQRHQAADGARWGFTANATGLGQGDPTTLTWSYVPDGTTFTGGCGVTGESNDPSDLIAYFNGLYGGPSVSGDLTTTGWHQKFVDAFDFWSNASGLNFVYEPNDDGVDYPTTSNAGLGSIGVRGDIRIGGHRLDGNSGVLACNYFPEIGDMIIDTDDNFYAISPNIGTVNVLTHELGHGLGFSHVCPLTETKLMEPFVSTAFLGTQEDDRLGANRLYGDREENNNTVATATNLSTLALPSTTTTTALSIDDNSDIDYFEFDISNAANITVTVSNIGSSYLQGPQTDQCDIGTDYDPQTFANLEVAVLDASGAVVTSSSSAGTGVDEVVNTSIAAGTSYIRIQQTGNTNNVQMYEFDIDLSPVSLNKPIASFTASNDGPIDICLGADFSIDFTDTSEEFPSSWVWTFTGAGVSPTSSTDQFPTVTVSSGGTLVVELVSSNTVGMSDIATQSIIINNLPITDASCLDGCIDLSNLDLANDNLDIINAPGVSGYVAGSNGYGDVSKAEEFLLSNSGICFPSVITGVRICAIVNNGTTGSLDVTVWDDTGANGTPGTVLGSLSVPVSDLALVDADGSGNFTVPAECAFVDFGTSPITINSDKFYIGISDLETLSGGNIGLVTNSDPEQIPVTGWEQWSNGNWFDYDEFWGFEIGNAIFPQLKPSEPTVAINLPTPVDGFCDDGTTYAFSENADLCTANAGTAETYLWEVKSGGTLVNTGTNATENFSFSSAGSYDIELCVVGVACEVNCQTETITVIGCNTNPCPPDYAGGNGLTGSENGTNDFETDGSIESTQTISNGAVVDYDSAIDILLNPDFEVILGAEFHAFIDGCGGNAIIVSDENMAKKGTIQDNTSYGLEKMENGGVQVTKLDRIENSIKK